MKGQLKITLTNKEGSKTIEVKNQDMEIMRKAFESAIQNMPLTLSDTSINFDDVERLTPSLQMGLPNLVSAYAGVRLYSRHVSTTDITDVPIPELTGGIGNTNTSKSRYQEQLSSTYTDQGVSRTWAWRIPQGNTLSIKAVSLCPNASVTGHPFYLSDSTTFPLTKYTYRKFGDCLIKAVGDDYLYHKYVIAWNFKKNGLYTTYVNNSRPSDDYKYCRTFLNDTSDIIYLREKNIYIYDPIAEEEKKRIPITIYPNSYTSMLISNNYAFIIKPGTPEVYKVNLDTGEETVIEGIEGPENVKNSSVNTVFYNEAYYDGVKYVLNPETNTLTKEEGMPGSFVNSSLSTENNLPSGIFKNQIHLYNSRGKLILNPHINSTVCNLPSPIVIDASEEEVTVTLTYTINAVEAN